MAQEAFYLNMGLPVYVRAVSSNSFAASVVEQGHALLFYNGTKMRAKLSSGNYIDVGGSSSTDFSVVTATVDDVLSPKQIYNNAGNLVTGNIQTVTASLDGNTVHIPKGYIAASDSITVSGGGGDADVILGVIDANGNFQKLKFNGTDASNSGSAQAVASYYTWNSTLPAPTPSGSMDFYKCSYVHSNSWGGYKALFTSGVYSFQSNSTSGLTYSIVVPEVGKTYTDGALVHVASLYGADKYYYLKLVINAVRDDTAGMQFSDFRLITPAGTELVWSSLGIVDVTANPDNDSPEGETPAQAFDNSTSTKWFSWSFSNPAYAIVHLTNPISDLNAVKYSWYTAGDYDQRDPISWQVFFSADGVNWHKVSEVWNFNTTESRNALVGTWDIEY